jgi:hypothetical protein
MSVTVSDPFGVTADAGLPTLARALDPAVVKRYFRRGLPGLAGEDGSVRLRAIRVTRHKPGRRCLIEYDVKVLRPGECSTKLTLIGKVRARRSGESDYQLQRALRDAGFQTRSPDGIAVAKPAGVLPKLDLWLQRKVPGQVATALLAAPGGEGLALRVAEAAHKLHRAGVPAVRRHGMADELRILNQCLRTVAQEEPRWAARIERLLGACVQLGASVPEPVLCGIHRDFYSDQVIVDGPRLYLIDFDLYCLGDPALDIGNFLGHITEQSLRTLGDAGALAEVERALEERFIELSGEAVRPAVRGYAVLTLARHIYLSTRFPERRPWTERLLELCEERLGVAARPCA